MPWIGFDQLKGTPWSVENSTLLRTKFKGKASQWRGKNLALVRQSIRAELLLAQKYRCAYCRRSISAEMGHHEIDHILPSSIHPQFTYTKFNLVATCKRCNWFKREHDPRLSKGSLVAYPLNPSSWKWIHPYFHIYSEHLKITDGMLFSPVSTTGPGFRRARAVIKVCRLDSLEEVVHRAIFEKAYAGQSHYNAAMLLVATWPTTSLNTLAEQLKTARDLKQPLQEVVNVLRDIRLGTLKAVLANVGSLR